VTSGGRNEPFTFASQVVTERLRLALSTVWFLASTWRINQLKVFFLSPTVKGGAYSTKTLERGIAGCRQQTAVCLERASTTPSRAKWASCHAVQQRACSRTHGELSCQETSCTLLYNYKKPIMNTRCWPCTRPCNALQGTSRIVRCQWCKKSGWPFLPRACCWKHTQQWTRKSFWRKLPLALRRALTRNKRRAGLIFIRLTKCIKSVSKSVFLSQRTISVKKWMIKLF